MNVGFVTDPSEVGARTSTANYEGRGLITMRAVNDDFASGGHADTALAVDFDQNTISGWLQLTNLVESDGDHKIAEDTRITFGESDFSGNGFRMPVGCRLYAVRMTFR